MWSCRKTKAFICIVFFAKVVSPLLTTDDGLARFRAWSKIAIAENEEFVVKEVPENDRNSRISHFGTSAFPESLQTSNAANVACSAGRLLLNGEKVSGAKRVKVGDLLSLSAAKTDRRTLLPDDPRRAKRFCDARLRLLNVFKDDNFSHSPLKVLYEDECMAIVSKPAGIHTMSWSGTIGKSLCLDDLLPLVLEPPRQSQDPLSAPLPRHRLDARVAGPVIVAKTRRALIELGRSFEEHTVEKEYRALLVGKSSALPSPPSTFTIESDIDGRESITMVSVLAHTPCNVDGLITDVKLFPKTGRKHQLRRHCAEVLGAPILGDDLHTNDKITVGRELGFIFIAEEWSFLTLSINITKWKQKFKSLKDSQDTGRKH
eukprot:CAMPEP_0195302794 /NCGR_PEP_ID=MMETSP0707-20130614/31687_1 /TAXON_ID=33640 /ORGANISM="Asterionellopsis glacialis, Strain CCMP134" /LENGTH=373 /DNA_ID=CAMNT_0040366141 /DNA_START=112 /DNA_END=1234 /DNA_ORIENTATION=-